MTPFDRSSRRTVPAMPNPRVPAGDDVSRLIGRWLRDGVPFVVLDPTGRHRDRLAAGRLDLSWSDVLRPLDVDAEVRRHGYALLDGANLPRRLRETVLTETLSSLRALRATGRGPAWILVDDVGSLPPGLLPDENALDPGAWAMASRDGDLPGWVAGARPVTLRAHGDHVDLVLVPAREAPAGALQRAHTAEGSAWV